MLRFRCVGSCLAQWLLVSVAFSCAAPHPARTVTARPATSASASASASTKDDVDDSTPEPVVAGALEPVIRTEPIQVTVGARSVDSEWETLRVELPANQIPEGDPSASVVSVTGPSAIAFVSLDSGDPVPQPRRTPRPRRTAVAIPVPVPTLWIRRPASAAGTPVEAIVRTPGGDMVAGEQYRVVSAPPTAASDAKLVKPWLHALASMLSRHSGPFYQFAGNRVAELGGAPQSQGVEQRTISTDLQELMATMSGQARLQEALQSNRRLSIQMDVRRRSVPLETVKLPELPTHAYADMLARLGKPVPNEPLAAAVPAEFYYVRARSLTALLDSMDRSELWADPAAQVIDGETRDASLSERYETALGLRRTALTRLLGPDVVSEIALTGSDPYVREGSDLTLIFRVKNRSLFEAALVQGLAERSRGHGDVRTSESAVVKGASVVASGDGAVHRVRATSGDLELVSNSEHALERVLGAIAKTRPRLADEPDFRYMLARDASVPDDVLGYVGERFVKTVVSAGQKIQEARRQLAVAELARPGYAALLHGWLDGRSPTSADQLVREGLLHKDELRHADGTPIQWSPGNPARSSYGTVASQTPLIDLPPVDKVTPDEATAYASFALDYRRDWSEYVDPIAVRLRVDPSEHGISARLRVLPVSQNYDLRQLLAMVGQTKVSAPPAARGVRAVLGVGRDAELRHEASEAVQALGRTLQIDWLGDWVMLGLDDGAQVAQVVAQTDEVPALMIGKRERGSRDEFRLLTELPLYAGVAIRHSAAAAVAITALRHESEGMLAWGRAPDHRKIAVWRVCEATQRSEERRSPCLFYALTGAALYASLSESRIHRLLDAELDGTAPAAPSQRDPGSQFLFDLTPRRGGGLYMVLAWALEAALLEHADQARDTAEALLRGAPESANDTARMADLARAIFGAVPVTIDGKFYVMRPDGVADPVWGTPHRPSWAPLPIAGSPVQRLLDAVPRFRSEMGFDTEPVGPGSAPTQTLDLRVEMSVAAEH